MTRIEREIRKDNDSTVMTLEEAARYLNVCRQTLARRARAGEVPCIIVGRQYRFIKSTLITAKTNDSNRD